MSQSLLHQVTYSDLGWDFPDPSNTRYVSQSLLHQVTYSDYLTTVRQLFNRIKCLNPFYIRSRIPTLKDETATRAGDVSIPFTSGHVFRRTAFLPTTSGVSMSQSLLHQVTYSDLLGMAAEVDAAQMSQSLLHQVTYSDNSKPKRQHFYVRVSIPFTSGHVFRPQRLAHEAVRENECLNPFYIRSRIPTLDHLLWNHLSRLSQSLLHQVTYSDTT